MPVCGRAGVIEGSSELGLSQQEYEAMSPQERETACQKVEERFRRAGAILLSGICPSYQIWFMLAALRT